MVTIFPGSSPRQEKAITSLRGERKMRDMQEFKVLKGINRLVTKEHFGVQSFLRKVLLTVNELIGSDIAFISLVEEYPEPYLVLRQKAESVVGREARQWSVYVDRLKIGGENLPRSERSVTGYVAYSKKSRRLGNVQDDPFYRESFTQIQSELAVPILLDGEVLGVINLESKTQYFYMPLHEELLDLVAASIAPTLEHLLVREGFHRPSLEIVEKIKEAFIAIHPDTVIEETSVLHDIAALIAKTLSSEHCTILVLKESESQLVPSGFFDSRSGRVNTNEAEQTQVQARMAMEEQSILTFGLAAEQEREDNQADLTGLEDTQKGQLVIAPLLVAGRAIGAIEVQRKRNRTQLSAARYEEYTARDKRLLNTLQIQVAAAINEHRGEARRRQQVRERLPPVADLLKIFAQFDLKTVLTEAVRSIPQLCGGRYCSIFLWDGQRNAYVLAATNGLIKEKIGEACYKQYEGLTGWVGATCRSLVLNNRALEDLHAIDPRLKWEAKYDEAGNRDQTHLRPFLAVPILSHFGGAEGIIRVTDRAQGLFSQVDEQILTLISTYLSTVIAYCRKYESRVKRLQILEALMVVIKTRLATRETRGDGFELALLRETAKQAKEILGANIVVFYRWNTEKAELERPPVCEGTIEDQAHFWMRPDIDDIALTILHDGPCYWNEQHNLAVSLVTEPKDTSSPSPSFLKRERIASLAAVPLKVGENLLGVLQLHFRVSQSFTQRLREDIEAFADQVALALEIADLSRKTHLCASREEGEYLSQELHDAVLQILTAEVANRAVAARDELQSGNYTKVAHDLQVIERAGDFCAEELRIVMGLLKHHAVEQYGLKAALESFIELWRPDTLEVNTDLQDMRGVPVELQRHMYRVAQVAFINVLRHAHSPRVDISLTATDNRLALCIQDYGVGFDPDIESLGEGQYGLKGTRRRVQGLEGTLQVTSRQGQGTTFTAELPIRGEEADYAY